jgi:ABC-2 type transport system ATP-binding protein
MDGPALEIQDLHKRYGDVIALDGVNLTAERGELIGLLGPNGAGKTTMVSIICGLRRADRGTVEVCGVDALADPQAARSHIGLAPQELGIYPIDTVRQNLSLFGELSGLRRGRLKEQLATVAEALRLGELMDRKAGELSGGQKRRLHTAIALLDEPSLILLDEATTGADVESRAALIDVVKGLANRGSSVLYSTHYLGEVEDLGARVVIIDHGRVIAEGAVPDLLAGNGGSVVELVFDGPPPSLDGRRTTYHDSTIRVSVDDPARSLGPIFSELGPAAARLQSVEIIASSLETVFLQLTGRRYEPEEALDVMAS